mmetsp:Transcript_50039/g.117854  ORF Transcript_50039/g.117854 Transcript_50039/m.117854 type:complete len:274 (+) Transcript_50039:658-1479(+)
MASRRVPELATDTRSMACDRSSDSSEGSPITCSCSARSVVSETRRTERTMERSGCSSDIETLRSLHSRRVSGSALSLVVAAEVSGSAPWPVGMRKARVEEQASGLALPASPPPSSDPDGSPNVKTSMTSLTKHRKTRWLTRLSAARTFPNSSGSDSSTCHRQLLGRCIRFTALSCCPTLPRCAGCSVPVSALPVPSVLAGGLSSLSTAPGSASSLGVSLWDRSVLLCGSSGSSTGNCCFSLHSEIARFPITSPLSFFRFRYVAKSWICSGGTK